MDPRIFNACVLAGLLMVFVGVGAQFSWPVALTVTGAVLILGTFAAARMSSKGAA